MSEVFKNYLNGFLGPYNRFVNPPSLRYRSIVPTSLILFDNMTGEISLKNKKKFYFANRLKKIIKLSIV